MLKRTKAPWSVMMHLPSASMLFSSAAEYELQGGPSTSGARALGMPDRLGIQILKNSAQRLIVTYVTRLSGHSTGISQVSQRKWLGGLTPPLMNAHARTSIESKRSRHALFSTYGNRQARGLHERGHAGITGTVCGPVECEEALPASVSTRGALWWSAHERHAMGRFVPMAMQTAMDAWLKPRS